MSSTPLLNSNTNPAKTSTPPTPGPSRFARGLLQTIGVLRAGLGAGCVLLPTLTLAPFAYPALNPAATVVLRMFGAREVVVASFLLAAERNRAAVARRGGSNSKEESVARKEVVRAIWHNAAADGMDVLILVAAGAAGALEGRALFMLVGAAGLLAGLGVELACLYGSA